jgi:uncharacterized membrane protein YccC
MKPVPWWRRASSFQHVVRTTVGALISLAASRLLTMPEAYWAPITTLIVMQTDVEATLAISARRLIGTALGAASGALLFQYFGPNIAAFGAGVFLTGVACVVLEHAHSKLSGYVDRTAYRYGGITLAVVLLIPHSAGIWKIAMDRFIEVSLGIVVALVLAKVWPGAAESAVATGD